MNLVSVFYKQISSSPSNICWRKCLFSILCFWHLCEKSDGCSCIDSYLALWFCSTGLHICFCTSAMLILLLWLCSTVWSRVLWYHRSCSICSVLPWQFVVFWATKCTLGFTFQSLWWMSFELWWGSHWAWRYINGNIAIFTILILPIHEHEEIFCSHLQFFSSVVYSCHCRGLSHPLLNLFLGIWFFGGYSK
jgi:hypothetical protein